VDVATALGTYLDIADSAAPGLVEGLYVVGSYALGDWVEDHSDIDVVVVTAEPATDDDYGDLLTVHAVLAEQQPLPHIDGPYLAWGDLVVEPATGLHRPWTLEGELHHDGDCFEINPVTWYTLARYGVTVRGTDPWRIGIPTDTEARIRFVVDNLNSYWRDVANDVAARAAAEPDRQWQPSALEWCGLGALRLHYTAFTADVTSKRGAGEYGLATSPMEFHPVVQRALAIRTLPDQTPPTSDEMSAAARLIAWVIDDVRAAAG
jgi:hypothetical protein